MPGNKPPSARSDRWINPPKLYTVNAIAGSCSKIFKPLVTNSRSKQALGDVSDQFQPLCGGNGVNELTYLMDESTWDPLQGRLDAVPRLERRLGMPPLLPALTVAPA